MNVKRPIAAIRGGLAALLLVALTASASLAAQKNYVVQSSDGVDIAVEEAGNPQGVPIVFIHGLLGSRIDWDLQLKSPDLQAFRLITYDLRGHGLSRQPQAAEAYRDGRRWADDLAAVLKESKVEAPVLVGWSLGGVVISNYLAAHGDTALGGVVYVDGVVELKPDLIADHAAVYEGLASGDLRTHLDAVRRFLRLCFQSQPDAESFERLLANAATASWTMTKSVPSMTVLAAEGLPKITVPALFLYGGKDALVNTDATIARARALNPRIEATIYADSGHAPFLEEPARFNRDLATFATATHKEKK